MGYTSQMVWLKRKLLLFSLACNIACFIGINLFCFQMSSMSPKENVVNQPGDVRYTLETNLLILILMSPGNVESRETIRKTWASDRHDGVLVKFALGTKDLSVDVLEMLNEERNQNGDMVYLTDFKESYQDLTKKLLLGLMWAANNCKFNYLLKADDDSYIRVDQVLLELKQKPADKLYWGFFDGRASVKKTGKYKENNYVLCDHYLPYALGGGYVLSRDLVQYVANNSNYLKAYKNEDVSLGTWLAPLDITRIHDMRFDTEYKSRGCSNSYIITHKQSPDDMRHLHSNLRNFNKLCVEEVRKRYGYNYNWTVSPSECCKRSADFV